MYRLWIVLLTLLIDHAQAGPLPSKVRIGTDDMRPWVDHEAVDYGIIARIVTRAFALVQVQTEFHWVPWKRLFHSTFGNTFEAVFPMGYSEARAQIFLFSDPLLTLDRVACHLKSQPFDWKTPEDFRGKTIAFRRGAYFGPLYTHLLDNKIATFIEADSDLSMMKMLLAGRVNLFFCQPREIQLSMRTYVSTGQLKPEDAAQLRSQGRPILSAPLHVGFPRHQNQGQDSMISVELRARFNRGLAKLKATEPQLFKVEQH